MLEKLLRTISATAILAALAAAASHSPESARAARLTPQGVAIASRLHPCQTAGVAGDTLCGTYEVFENRPKRAGRKISLNIVVLPALGSTKEPDPLFVFAGGPGQAATDGAAGYAQVFAVVRNARDIVLIDQRGTGRSNPLNCEFSDLNEIVEALFAGHLPVQSLKACRNQLEQKADLKQYTTPIAADDIDEVRDWLGYDRINLYGSSYGSRPALVYMSRHTSHVRSAVIKSVAPQDYKNPLYNPRDAQKSLDHLFADCEHDPSCAKAFPTLRSDTQKVLDKLARTPAIVTALDSGGGAPTDISITREVFAGALRRALLDVNSQRSIPLSITKALNGDFKNFGPFFAAFRSVSKSFSFGMNLSVTCAEDAPLIKREEIERVTKGKFLGDTLVRSVLKVCREWPRGELPKDFYRPTRNNVPVLVISGQLDPDAPPEWGDEVVKNFPNGRHLIVEGMSHLSPPKCLWAVIGEFFAAGSVKKLDTSCLANSARLPFVAP
ncbi:MAG TPA: alpha/beta fold hydrolase [Pyrinomonadaceae bacterium]|nr:alpha/beta fold hydrolase [Pyrinomonadaceae bacterium]